MESQKSESVKPQNWNNTNMAKFKFYISEQSEERGWVDVPEPVLGDSPEQVKNIYKMIGKNVRIRHYEPCTPKSLPAQPPPANNSLSTVANSNIPKDGEPVNLPYKPVQSQEIQLTKPTIKSKRYYELNDEKFMIDEFGDMYVLSWKDLEDTSIIRIISNKTFKPVDMVGKTIQIRYWKKIEKNLQKIEVFDEHE